MISVGAFRGSLGKLLSGHALYDAILSRRAPVALRLIPPTPFAGDALKGAALARGRLPLGDDGLGLDLGQSWTPAGADRQTIKALNGFEWLADLRAQGGADARRRARELVARWIDDFPVWHEITWAGDVLGRRLYNWLAAFEFFAASAEEDFCRRVMDSLIRQARHLARTLPEGDGLDRLAALKTLVVAGLALDGYESWIERNLRQVLRTLDRQLLHDGGHASRNPSAQLELLRHLIELRAALRAGEREPPQGLDRAIDRSSVMLRMLRHGDGRLAQFNGGREEAREEVEQALAQAWPHARTPAEAPEWGYDRMSAGRTLLLIDTGRPPPVDHAQHAHAGPLSFELSSGRERLIVNAGGRPGERDGWRMAQRSTAAHSTLTVDDTNAVELLPGGFGRVMGKFTRARTEVDGNHWLDAAHDGYRHAFGLLHRRRIYLDAGGDDVRGEDTLTRIGDGRRVAQSCVARFHLHPNVRAALVDGGRAALLRLPNGGGFRLQASGAQLALAESIYFGGPGAARPTQQVVLSAEITGSGAPGEVAARLRWTIKRVVGREALAS
ncbi:MAG: hypothetical protein EXQ88_03780 [Alphaproteobacteria bacterium]|nr:hypothetical protein [Alphaproteobacteria bacterium]